MGSAAASSVESRFEALHASGITALIGRDEELELLLRRWARAKTGEGQMVLISGEAGIGKSRLTAAVLESLAAEPHTRLRYFCSPEHTDSPLYPIISQMERAAGLAYDDDPQAKLDKLDAMLAHAWRCIGEALMAIEATKERSCEAEVNRIAGEIALMSPKPDAPKAEAYFDRALAIARRQQAKSWELRAAMSMVRLWRDQGKRQQARDLLAPVYGWFTEGFDTLDLKQAKALLDELAQYAE
jgi:AAA ATPase domain